jgi:hypothetical protein
VPVKITGIRRNTQGRRKSRGSCLVLMRGTIHSTSTGTWKTDDRRLAKLLRYRIPECVSFANPIQTLQRAMAGYSIGSCCTYSTALFKQHCFVEWERASWRDRRGRTETAPSGFVRQPKLNSWSIDCSKATARGGEGAFFSFLLAWQARSHGGERDLRTGRNDALPCV